MQLRKLDGRSWRAAVVRRLPVALMEYAFECFAAILGALLGAFLLIGVFKPGSLFFGLPIGGVRVYAASSLLAAGTIFAGLVCRPANPVLMAVGLRLFGCVLTVYAVAVVWLSGIAAGGIAGLFFILLAALAGFRSLFLRASAEEAHRVARTE